MPDNRAFLSCALFAARLSSLPPCHARLFLPSNFHPCLLLSAFPSWFVVDLYVCGSRFFFLPASNFNSRYLGYRDTLLLAEPANREPHSEFHLRAIENSTWERKSFALGFTTFVILLSYRSRSRFLFFSARWLSGGLQGTASDLNSV